MVDSPDFISPEERRQQNPVYVIWPIRPDGIVVIDSRPSWESQERAELMVKGDLLKLEEEFAMLKDFFTNRTIDEEIAKVFQTRLIGRLNDYRPEFPNRGIVEITFWYKPLRFYFQSEDWANIYQSIANRVDLDRVEVMAQDLMQQEQRYNYY